MEERILVISRGFPPPPPHHRPRPATLCRQFPAPVIHEKGSEWVPGVTQTSKATLGCQAVGEAEIPVLRLFDFRLPAPGTSLLSLFSHEIRAREQDHKVFRPVGLSFAASERSQHSVLGTALQRKRACGTRSLRAPCYLGQVFSSSAADSATT